MIAVTMASVGKATHLQEALRQSEERFSLLVESVQDYAIFMLDPTGRIISWNRGAERIKGYTEAEIIGQHFSIFYTQSDRDRRFPDFELRVAGREGRFEDEGWRVRKDGTRFWANVIITALRDQSGQLVGFGKVTRDLTERIQAEGERRALEKEREARRIAEELSMEVRRQARRLEEQAAALERLNGELRDANLALVARTQEAERARSDAETASRAKSDFLANMSHELRTPINAILGFGDLLAMGIPGPVNEKQQAQLERIRLSTRHLLMLIDDILDLSKIEAGRVKVQRTPAPLGEAVAAALALLSPEAEERALTLEDRCATSDRELRYVGDENRVRQILVNLVSNAVKFTDPGGRIAVSCALLPAGAAGAPAESTVPWVRATVEDTGIGIPAELHESIFDPFVQAESGRTRTRGGTGLGLAISRRLARLMDGDLTVESESGKGSSFSLWLPSAS